MPKPRLDIAASLTLGQGHHQGGRLPEAEQLYRSVLEADPENADANHLLGVLAYQSGDLETAGKLIAKAPVIALQSAEPRSRLSLGVLLRQAGLGGFIAESPEAYVELARELATDVDRLRTIRAQLRQTLQHRRCSMPPLWRAPSSRLTATCGYGANGVSRASIEPLACERKIAGSESRSNGGSSCMRSLAQRGTLDAKS